MTEEFFGKNIQDALKSGWTDPADFRKNVAIDFTSYYTDMDGLPYKSARYEVDGFKFGSHIAWWMPKRKSSISIEITMDDLTNSSSVEGTETGFTLSQPYGMELAHLQLAPGEKGIFVDKGWFNVEGSEEIRPLKLSYTKGKNYRSSRKYNSFVLSPQRGLVGSNGKDTTSYDFGDFYKESRSTGWSAVSAEVLDEHTLRVYMTDALYRENVDFHNLVLQLKFSETLEACRVGFNDIPNYFGEIASRGVDGETILKERFGDSS